MMLKEREPTILKINNFKIKEIINRKEKFSKRQNKVIKR